jgi:acyl carrier protein
MAQYDRKDTQTKVISLIADELSKDPSALSEASSFQDIGADSLDVVEIIMKLEEYFGLEIKDEDAEKMKTIHDIIDYVQAHRTK